MTKRTGQARSNRSTPSSPRCSPVAKKTNVLYSVSAQELAAADMIKLPVMLAEHAVWADAVRDAVLRRKQLEAEAASEKLRATTCA